MITESDLKKLQEKAKYLALQCEKTSDIIEHVSSFSEGGSMGFVCAVQNADKNKHRTFIALQNKILKFEFDDLTKHTDKISKKLYSVTSKEDVESIQRRVSHVQKDFNEISDHYLRFLKWISRNCNQSYVSQIFNYSSEQIQDLRDQNLCDKEKIPPSAVLWLIRKDSPYVQRRVHCMPNATFKKNDSFGNDGDIVIDKIGNWLLLAKETVESGSAAVDTFLDVESIINKISIKFSQITKDIPKLATEIIDLQKNDVWSVSGFGAVLTLLLISIKLLFVALKIAAVSVDAFVIFPASYLYKKFSKSYGKKVEKLRASIAYFISSHKYKITLVILYYLAILHDEKESRIIIRRYIENKKRISEEEANNLLQRTHDPEVQKLIKEALTYFTPSMPGNTPSLKYMLLKNPSFFEYSDASVDRWFRVIKTKLYSELKTINPYVANMQNATSTTYRLELHQKSLRDEDNNIHNYQAAIFDRPTNEVDLCDGVWRDTCHENNKRSFSKNGDVAIFSTFPNPLYYLIRAAKKFDNDHAVQDFMNSTELSRVRVGIPLTRRKYLDTSDNLMSEKAFMEGFPLNHTIRQAYDKLYKELGLNTYEGWESLQDPTSKIFNFPAPLGAFCGMRVERCSKSLIDTLKTSLRNEESAISQSLAAIKGDKKISQQVKEAAAELVNKAVQPFAMVYFYFNNNPLAGFLCDSGGNVLCTAAMLASNSPMGNALAQSRNLANRFINGQFYSFASYRASQAISKFLNVAGFAALVGYGVVYSNPSFFGDSVTQTQLDGMTIAQLKGVIIKQVPGFVFPNTWRKADYLNAALQNSKGLFKRIADTGVTMTRAKPLIDMVSHLFGNTDATAEGGDIKNLVIDTLAWGLAQVGRGVGAFVANLPAHVNQAAILGGTRSVRS
ncbi:MAG: hypothetical protein CMO44_13195 [Verrucomicrobiales bacterium]|nr:hypothetical protein [Verrucomicrobiales bacterium]